jgi:hypothetical protein
VRGSGPAQTSSGGANRLRKGRVHSTMRFNLARVFVLGDGVGKGFTPSACQPLRPRLFCKALIPKEKNVSDFADHFSATFILESE